MNETFQIAILMGDLSVIFRILKVFFFFKVLRKMEEQFDVS